MITVTLYFKGHVDVEVDADPDNSEAWATAIGLAYDQLTATDIAVATELVEHEIVER